MERVSTREFRENLKVYLDRVDCGQEILIQRGKNKRYKLVLANEDDTLMSKEDFLAKINKSLIQYQNGESKTFTTPQELETYFASK